MNLTEQEKRKFLKLAKAPQCVDYLQNLLRHAIQSNHGYKPDACSACGEIQEALK